MNTPFARALIAMAALALVCSPTYAHASTKGESKAVSSKPTKLGKTYKSKHAHAHASVAKKEPKLKSAKLHAPKAKPSKEVAAAPAAAAPAAPAAMRAVPVTPMAAFPSIEQSASKAH